MEQEYINRVEAYFKGTLGAEEKAQFEADVEKDPQLKELYQEYGLAIDAIDQQVEDDLRGQFRIWEAEKETKTGTMVFLLFWKVAASVTLIMGISYGLYVYDWGVQTGRELALKNYTLPPSTGNEMGTGSELWSKGMERFEQQDYSAAIEYWSQITDPTDEMQYYMAHAYFLMDNFDKAASLFEHLSSTINTYRAGADWNLLLTYLANEDTLKFRQQVDTITSRGSDKFSKMALELAKESKY